MPGKINVSDFALQPTLECGQVFRWQRAADCWFVGVIGNRVARLRQQPGGVDWELYPPHLDPLPRSSGERKVPSPLKGEGPETQGDEFVIRHYLALDVPLGKVVASFPDDEILQQAVKDHYGLRVIRQEPWECLASFIASSTKQIVQIRQIVSSLAAGFGKRIETPFGMFHSFPAVQAIACASHERLWSCKLGFRAKNLLAAARMIDSGEVKLERLHTMEYKMALGELTKLPGVGEKVASCVLLFSCGFDQAFPIDVWIERALRRIYFPGEQNVTPKRLREFVRTHFGPYAGWAQQYLFFSERTRGRQPLLNLSAQ